MSNVILPISNDNQGVPVVSTLDFADGLSIQHKSLLETIRNYLSSIESQFGRVAFQTRPFETPGGTQYREIALLTEDQALFVGTLSRNSERVIEFKAVLIRSFSEARKRLSVASQTQLPQTYKQALTELLSQIEENERLQAENETLKPIVHYAENVLLSQSDILTTVIAKELGKSAVTLNRILKEKGVQHKVGNTWVLNHRYQDKGYTRIRTHVHSSTAGNMRSEHHLVWTEKGRQFIHSLVNPNLGNTSHPGIQPGIA